METQQNESGSRKENQSSQAVSKKDDLSDLDRLV
jgi:hypothetical protein